MTFRKSKQNDIDNIMNIICQAQIYFKQHNINQWQDGYPDKSVIHNDILKGNSYVLYNESEILATVAISFDRDSNYNTIYDGNWLSNLRYAVIHRIAVRNDLKGIGIASTVIKKVENLCISNKVSSIKVDTHEDNLPMQNTLKKNGFIYCGIIYLEDKSKRIAFEKILPLYV